MCPAHGRRERVLRRRQCMGARKGRGPSTRRPRPTLAERRSRRPVERCPSSVSEGPTGRDGRPGAQPVAAHRPVRRTHGEHTTDVRSRHVRTAALVTVRTTHRRSTAELLVLQVWRAVLVQGPVASLEIHAQRSGGLYHGFRAPGRPSPSARIQRTPRRLGKYAPDTSTVDYPSERLEGYVGNGAAARRVRVHATRRSWQSRGRYL